MKYLLSNKKFKIITIVIMLLIFIILYFTKGFSYGIKISEQSLSLPKLYDAGDRIEIILLIYNIILIVSIVTLNILFCIFSKKKVKEILILICFIVFGMFIPVIAKNSYDITIAGVSEEISNSEKLSIIDMITHN